MQFQDTVPALTFARRSCAVPAELTARRSTLARSANQHLTSLIRAPSWKMAKPSPLVRFCISLPEASSIFRIFAFR